MRWRPDAPTCSERGFDWRCSRESAIAEVAGSPDAVGTALAGVLDPTERTAERWSASMYLWHLVDVLRIGTERLLTLTLDAERGIPCWDENALAENRRYAQLSPLVGLALLERAVPEWVEVAESTSDEAQADHPVFGALGALDVIRRNAHEVHHHIQDVERWRSGSAALR